MHLSHRRIHGSRRTVVNFAINCFHQPHSIELAPNSESHTQSHTPNSTSESQALDTPPSSGSQALDTPDPNSESQALDTPPETSEFFNSESPSLASEETGDIPHIQSVSINNNDSNDTDTIMTSDSQSVSDEVLNEKQPPSFNDDLWKQYHPSNRKKKQLHFLP